MLQIRAAEPADAAVIFQLIGELADYERLRHEVVGSVEDLRSHLFSEPRYAHVLVAEWDGEVVGFALYFFSYSTFLCRPGIYLEDLFVRASMRGRGVGLGLLSALEQQARELGCGRLEWAVLDWNRSAIDFYHRFGAHPHDGWTVYRKELTAPPPTQAATDSQPRALT
jgi:GNAT superfamily N-acetyltransferase